MYIIFERMHFAKILKDFFIKPYLHIFSAKIPTFQSGFFMFTKSNFYNMNAFQLLYGLLKYKTFSKNPNTSAFFLKKLLNLFL